MGPSRDNCASVTLSRDMRDTRRALPEIEDERRRVGALREFDFLACREALESNACRERKSVLFARWTPAHLFDLPPRRSAFKDRVDGRELIDELGRRKSGGVFEKVRE